MTVLCGHSEEFSNCVLCILDENSSLRALVKEALDGLQSSDSGFCHHSTCRRTRSTHDRPCDCERSDWVARAKSELGE